MVDGITQTDDGRRLYPRLAAIVAAAAASPRWGVHDRAHALTRPWTVTKSYHRVRNPTWIEDICAENNMYVFIGKESYFLGADRNLMPTIKDQAPPDLRNFGQAPK
jgi:hypothetical protein